MKKLISIITVAFLTTGINADLNINDNEISKQISEQVKMNLEEDFKKSEQAMLKKLKEEIRKINAKKIEEYSKKKV